MEQGSQFLAKWKYILKIVIPLTILVGVLKLIFHSSGWEFISTNAFSFLSSVFTGIIFIIGFMLAAILADHKESEKFPGEIIMNLYSISREADFLRLKGGIVEARGMQENLSRFLAEFRSGFLLNQSDRIFEILDSFTENFYAMDEKGVAPPSMARIKGDQANLARVLLRMKSIRDTMFAPGVYSILEAVIVLFGLAILFLKFDSILFGIYFICFSIFLLSSVLIILKDLENPFEYKEQDVGINEIDFSLVFAFENTIKNKLKDGFT